MYEKLRTNTSGVFSIMISAGNATDLKYLLDPEVPFVHIADHYPKSDTNWWHVDVPRVAGQPMVRSKIRLLSYDLEFTTTDFLTLLGEFSPFGLSLVQTEKSFRPDRTLRTLSAEERRNSLLDGVFAIAYELPHHGECAQFSSGSLQRIEHALAHPKIAERAY